MITMQRSQSPLNLRRTCDRCRELKVRCDRLERADGNFVLEATVCRRCSRAGTGCTFSQKERSGRPRIHAVHDTVHDTPWMPSSPSQPLLPGSSPSTKEAIGSNWDALQELLTETPDPFFPDSADATSRRSYFSKSFNGMQTPLSQGPHSSRGSQIPDCLTPPQSEIPGHSFDRDTAHDIAQDTSELSKISICFLQLQALLKKDSPPTVDRIGHEIAEATNLLLSFLHQFRQRPPSASGLNPGPYNDVSILSKQDEQTLHSRMIRLSVYRGESSSNGLMDSGILFLLLSCYQRLLCLLQDFCVFIHLQIEKNIRKGMSNIKTVMTAELVSHLLGQLNRGFDNLFSAKSSPNPATAPDGLSGTRPETMMQFEGGSLIPCNGSIPSCWQMSETPQSGKSLWAREISGTFDGMVALQIDVQRHVTIIKEILRESHTV